MPVAYDLKEVFIINTINMSDDLLATINDDDSTEEVEKQVKEALGELDKDLDKETQEILDELEQGDTQDA